MSRVSRVSEAAAPPPPESAAPAPAAPAPRAPQAKIPQFASEEGPVAEAVVQHWDDYAPDDGGMPQGDARGTSRSTGVSVEGTDAELAPKGPKVKVDVAGTDAEDDHLDASGAMPATPASDDDEEEPPPVAASARRRGALDALGLEQQKRGLETTLVAERERREKLEKTLKTASLGELLAARGLTRDDALEQLVAGTEGKAPEAEAKGDPEVLALKEKVRLLEERDQQRERRDIDVQEERVLGVVHGIAATITDAKVVQAAIKAGTMVDRDKTTGRPLTAGEVIRRAAQRMWEKAGEPPGRQKYYVKQATLKMEDLLTEQHSPLAAALAEKQGNKSLTPSPAPRRGISRRNGARPDPRPAPLPTDRDALDAEIKRRYRLL